MIDFVKGLFSGIAISGLLFIFILYPSIKESWYQQGVNSGAIGAKYEIAKKLRDEFGVVSETGNMAPLFRVKTTSVYIVEREGIKVIEVVD